MNIKSIRLVTRSLFFSASVLGASPLMASTNVEIISALDAQNVSAGGVRIIRTNTIFNSGSFVAGHSAYLNGTSGTSSWLYNGASTAQTGLLGSAYTTTDTNYRASYTTHLSSSGYAAGHSLQFNDIYSNAGGRGAWLYDGSSSIELGLFSAPFTNTDGNQHSEVNFLTNNGGVAGTARRYDGGTITGHAAWVYNGAGSVDISLYNEHFTDTSTQKVYGMNDAGIVVGTASESAFGPDTQWVYDGTETRIISLTDAEHTRADGVHDTNYKYDNDSYLNQAGDIIGNSYRYDGMDTAGVSAWLYDGTSSINIGETSGHHTSAGGHRTSMAVLLNEAGQVAGTSFQFDGEANVGVSSWIYDKASGSRTVVGLYDAEHSNTGGFSNNQPARNLSAQPRARYELNEAGQLIGTALRYSGDAERGQSAWFYDGESTRIIGLQDAQHTDDTGERHGMARLLNENGQVAGESTRYDIDTVDALNNGGNGQSAWFFDGENSVKIGDESHEVNVVSQINEAGDVLGSGVTITVINPEIYEFDIAQTAWLYDASLEETFTFTLSERSDGFSFSEATYLDEEGNVLGYYSLFDEEDNDLGLFAFYFSVEQGLWDLAEYLALEGIDVMDEFGGGSLLGMAAGDFLMTGTDALGSAVYKVSASQVPVPGAAWLLGSALIGLAGIKRRK